MKRVRKTWRVRSMSSPWRKGYADHELYKKMHEAKKRAAQEEFLDITRREDLSPLETRLDELALPGIGDARHRNLEDDEF